MTVPVSVNPLTVPVPPTEVTVPVLAPVAIPSSLVLSAEVITPASDVVAAVNVALVPVLEVTGTVVVVRVP